MSSQYYLTTPLYYVNDVPHIGHAYTTILADVLARYQRLLHPDRHVHFLTGLDEHGQKVARAAAAAGKMPQTHCDEMSVHWKGVWERLGIQYDDFIRTTEPRHVEVVLNILNKLNDKGDIYRKEYEGWYSVYEERFFTEKDLIDGKDPIGGKPVEYLKESNYFFKMGQYQQWLIDHYDNHPNAVLPEFRLNEVKGFLRQPLDDLCISRPKARLSWGIPIPWDEDYVTYVWFDALTNYYSATVHPRTVDGTVLSREEVRDKVDGTVLSREEETRDKTVAPTWPADYHLIGKDILTTHAVYWPIMLHAAGLEPPRHILAHGWWLDKSAAKMSKSGGNVVDPLSLVDKYGADAFRYVLMRDMTVGQDANFSEESFIQRYNSDLANDLGNLYSRLAKLWGLFDWSRMPPKGSFRDVVDEEISNEFGYQACNLKDIVTREIETLRPHAAIECIRTVVRGLNRAIERCEPWNADRRGDPAVAISMGSAAQVLYLVSELLEPVMPGKMAKLKERLKPDGHSLNLQPGAPLFPRIQPTVRTAGRRDTLVPHKPMPDKSVGPPQPTTPSLSHSVTQLLVSLEDFAKLDIRTAKVLSARRVKGTDKLIALEIDLGSTGVPAGREEEGREPSATDSPTHRPTDSPIRQIVAGIGKSYQPEELIGKTIIVVANLKPTKLKGELSQGMLLAATDGDTLILLTTDRETPPGAKIN